VLLNAGANPDLKSKKGELAKDLTKNEEMIHLLDKITYKNVDTSSPLTLKKSEFQEFMERLVAVELERHQTEQQLIESQKQVQSKNEEIENLRHQVSKLNELAKSAVKVEMGLTVPAQPTLKKVGSTEALGSYDSVEADSEKRAQEKLIKRLEKKLERSEKKVEKLTKELETLKSDDDSISSKSSKSDHRTIRKLESQVQEQEELIKRLETKVKQMEKEKKTFEQIESDLKQQLAEKSHKRGCFRPK
jgi:uncharacterized protein (DUF3084 family)